ncbi:Hypothetical predicted protein [Prunus dulcis]|uniref:Uncharacterized protein n=1 Tax=Prunus dulcis TaxID=3755 RepID=A0A5E4FEY0_PRUDU|nr:Hypothetical predicted protein [Prunus dulcis]
MVDFVLPVNIKTLISREGGQNIKHVASGLNLQFEPGIHLTIRPQVLDSILDEPGEVQLLNNGKLVAKLFKPEGHCGLISLVKVPDIKKNSEVKVKLVSRSPFKVDVPFDLWTFIDKESTRCFVICYAPTGGSSNIH